MAAIRSELTSVHCPQLVIDIYFTLNVMKIELFGRERGPTRRC